VFVAFVSLVICQAVGIDDEWMITPAGIYHKHCVHRVGNHANIAELEDTTVVVTEADGTARVIVPCNIEKKIPKGVMQQYDGWLAYTTAKAPVDFDAFLGYFSVPQEPANYPSVLYLFTGLQDVNWIPIIDPQPSVFDIIQPVLQYPADSGDGWSVKSWYVTLTGDVLVTDEMAVNVGDSIFGNMTRINETSWFIGGTDVQSGSTVSLSVNRNTLVTQPWAYCTAECYGCQDCTTEPANTIVFSKMQLSYRGKPVVPKWTTATTPNPLCYEQATVNSPSSVTISFQQQN